MSDTVIKVEGLSKLYRIGSRQNDYRTLRDIITDAITMRLSRLRKGIESKRLEGNSDLFALGSPLSTDTIWALKDISFEIKRGEVVGIIGRNGAGKSTLLKILSRITEPTEGHAEIHGRMGSLLEVGTGFHPELTGRENIYLNGAILGMRKTEIEQKFDEIVAFAEVEKFIDTPVKHYSSGMYVRLAFAVAAHLEPEILLVDEVLAVGDIQFQKKCLGKMGDVARKGRTVLFVSHNINALQQLCGKALLLVNGGLDCLSGDVYAVTKRYLFGNSNIANTGEWINPGFLFENSYFKPLRFTVCDDQGRTLPMPLMNDAQGWIQVEGQVEHPDPALTIGYAIYTETSELLYWSYQTDVAEHQWSRLGRGRWIIRSQFPRRLLNEGSYRVEFIGGLHFRNWLFAPGMDVPSILLTIQGGLSDSPLWMQKRPGILAPILEWEVMRENVKDPKLS